MTDLLKLNIEQLPTFTGCYLMKSESRIVYVGQGGQPSKPR
jgi:Nuclease subunit of the excinuclease complex